jgi:hypothetical protein
VIFEAVTGVTASVTNSRVSRFIARSYEVIIAVGAKVRSFKSANVVLNYN